MNTIKYELSFPNPLTHFIHITMYINDINSEELELILPDWRPGRYELSNYVSNIKEFKIFSKNEDVVDFRKKEKNKWIANTSKHKGIKIKYTYYANRMDAGGSVVNEEQVYINFINCLLYYQGMLDQQLEVSIDVPVNYLSSCSLQKKENNTYLAKNYAELVDSPFISSESLKRLIYHSASTEFNIYILGECPLEDAQIINDFKKFTDLQIKQMNGFPSGKFDFIVHSLPYRHYHGVEHQNSTVLVLGPNTAESKEKYCMDLLGVASHELFHAWNVTRIRPAEMMPYDYSKENYYETGFVTEGFTTYYGDLFLARSGVFDEIQYLNELNTIFKRHFENYGRHNLSLTDSSFDLWIDGYKKLLPSRKVSIYVKGATVALMLDLTIRKHSSNQHSLDDIMTELWNNFGKIEKGYSKQDVYDLINKYAGAQANAFIEKYYEGIVPVENELKELLAYIGCELTTKNHPESSASLLGFRTETNSLGTIITEIAPNSIAEKHLSVGDEILTINEKKVVEEGLTLFSENCTLLIKRNHKEKLVTLLANDERYYQIYEITRDSHATDQCKENFKLWIGNE
ncbi:PDZ domain-containing protein [Reichenbachiella sp. MALMAid0571]|uniref:M61 family metallopeptidase n=1 Tax=Reichenbachiella sp. MALMAid0571 TaxID=3143939 RepID=UPI0032DF16E0